MQTFRLHHNTLLFAFKANKLMINPFQRIRRVTAPRTGCDHPCTDCPNGWTSRRPSYPYHQCVPWPDSHSGHPSHCQHSSHVVQLITTIRYTTSCFYSVTFRIILPFESALFVILPCVPSLSDRDTLMFLQCIYFQN